MTELTEAETAQLNAGRVMRAESDVLMPLLQAKQALVVGRIVQCFRSGDRDAVFAAAAELATLHDMRTTINQTIKKAEAIERKVYAGE